MFGLGIIDIIQGVSEKEAIDFLNHLSKYPMLGLLHDIGKKSFETSGKQETKLVSDTEIFRCRSWEKGQTISYVEDLMFAPPIGISFQGRFNPHGISTLYFASTKESTLAESNIVPGAGRFTIMRVKPAQPLTIIDLSETVSPIVELCNKPVSCQSTLKLEYLVPNFLGQCCKFHGIKGVVYQSYKNIQLKNYAFFDVFKDCFNVLELSS